jgi:pimeloyl-ACP methyl ester carboxylesterase
MKATLIQGRYDIICAPQTAWDLHKAWPETKLIWIAAAGHSVKVRLWHFIILGYCKHDLT